MVQRDHKGEGMCGIFLGTKSSLESQMGTKVGYKGSAKEAWQVGCYMGGSVCLARKLGLDPVSYGSRKGLT